MLPYDISVGYADAKETRLALEERTVMDPNVTDNHIIIEAGNSRPLNTVHPERHRLLFRLKNYMEQDWDGEIVIGILKDEFTPCVLTSRGRTINTADDPDKQDTVLLGIRTLKEDGTIFLTIYSPFWMINKTGLMLTYKKPLRDHVATITQPLLYSTSYGNLQEKRKISVKVSFRKLFKWKFGLVLPSFWQFFRLKAFSLFGKVEKIGFSVSKNLVVLKNFVGFKIL